MSQPEPASEPVVEEVTNRTSPILEIDVGVSAQPCFGEEVSGDIVVVDRRGELALIGIVDVLGHGKEAHKLSLRIESILLDSWAEDVAGTMTHLHEALKGSRGAAAGLVVADVSTGELRYVGVGNTVARLFGPQARRLLSTDGTLGYSIRSLREQKFRIDPPDILVMYTDGVRDRVEVNDLPQGSGRSSLEMAKAAVNRFGKAYDDATCVVVRFRR